MTTYYHVVHESYQEGEDILTLAELIEDRWGKWGWVSDRDMGWGKTPWGIVEETLRHEGLYKWDQDLAGYMARDDAEGVSLYETLDDAIDHAREHGRPASMILAVELPQGEVVSNCEGYAFWSGRIPAESIAKIIRPEEDK